MSGLRTYPFEHSQLGRLVGRQRNEHVVQFRSVPYGYIPARFRQAQLIDNLSPIQRVCTEYTFACPQHEQTMEAFGGQVDDVPRRYNEFDCLNLTITAPTKVLDRRDSERVPVMVYVHGGGLMQGAHYGGVQGKLVHSTLNVGSLCIDMTKIVAASSRQGKPIVAVSINYRLHLLGFLACNDLTQDAFANGESPCNFGLYDQRLAFLWIKKYIDGFGGDTDQITAIGESAGSASLCFHMSSTVPLFNRVILESGTAATIIPMPIETKEFEYLSLLAYCNIDIRDSGRLEKLRAVPIETLVNAADSLSTSLSPLAHTAFFSILPNLRNHAQVVASCRWVQAVVIGDAVFEGYLFSRALQGVQTQRFCQHLESVLGAERASRVLYLYEISSAMDPNLFWTRLCVFCGDIMISIPTHVLARTIAQRSTKKLYRYFLSLRNPFIGSHFSGVLGHHSIELIYQFLNLTHRLPLKIQRDVSMGFANRWISFARGEAPWEQYRIGAPGEDEEMVAVADERQGWVVRSRIQDLDESLTDGMGQRRYKAWNGMVAMLEELGEDAPAVVQALSFAALAKLVDLDGMRWW